MNETPPLRLLLLAFWAPPLIRPRAIQIGKLVPEWIRQGVEPVIVRYADLGEWEAKVPLYGVPIFRAGGLAARFALGRFLVERRYYAMLFERALSIIKEHAPRVVFSFSNPQASNILGAHIKRRLGLPFIAHFSDPFADNPYKEFSFLGRLHVLRQERFIIEQSDRVVFTNQAALELVMKKYPPAWRAKARVIPHAFDPREYPESVKPPLLRGGPVKRGESHFVIRHVGAFYKRRNPEILFKALEALFRERPELRARCRVELVGAINEYTDYSEEKLCAAVARYGLNDIVTVSRPVQYRESLALMKSADLLVVIDADARESPFLPSKLVDYAGSGTPIVGITPAESPTADFLRKAGYKAFGYGELREIVDCLGALLGGSFEAEPNAAYVKQFSIERVAALFIQEFESVEAR